MKKIMLLFALFLCFIAAAQINYPYKHPELLIGKEVKVEPLTYQADRSYSNFYTDEKMLKTYEPVQPYTNKTKPEMLENKTFKVLNVERLPNHTHRDYYRIILENAEGQKLYYNYRNDIVAKYDYCFEVIGGLTVDESYFCDFIQEEKGEFRGDGTSIARPGGSDISIIRKVKNNVATYTMKIRFTSEYNSKSKRGIFLTLENGKKIVKAQAPVLVKPLNPIYEFNATLKLTDADLALLKENQIVSYKLVDSNEKLYTNFDKTNPIVLKGMVNCLTKK